MSGLGHLLATPDPARLALTPICFHLGVNGSKSHTEVTSGLLPAPIPRAEDAGVSQEKLSKEQLIDRESGTNVPPWQWQTGRARTSLGFSVAAGLVQIRGCLGLHEDQGWLCCVRRSSLSTCAIAGWEGGHCYAPGCTPKQKYTHTRAGEVPKISCGSLEAHGQKG